MVYITVLVINALGGGHTLTHEPKQFCISKICNATIKLQLFPYTFYKLVKLRICSVIGYGRIQIRGSKL